MLKLLKKLFSLFEIKSIGTGYVEDRSDSRDIIFGELVKDVENEEAWKEYVRKLPVNYRLDYKKDWLYSQGSTSSCVFHSATGLLNYIYKDKFSPRFLSRFGFRLSGLKWGAYMRDGVKALDKFGSIAYDKAPNNSSNTSSDSAYRNYYPDSYLYNEAAQKARWLYVRVDERYGNLVDFDSIKVFIDKEKMPCVVGLHWWNGWGDIKDEETIDYARGNKKWGHAMLCIGWEGEYLILVDSANRIIKLHRRNKTMDVWGILVEESIEKYHLEIRPERKIRNVKLEKRNATKLKNELYNTFAEFDKARLVASRFWFPLIDALTYNGYTAVDLMNWLSFYKRNNYQLFDITQHRSITIKKK